MILREFIATFGIKMDEKGLDDANSKLNKFAAGVQKALVALGFLYVGNKIKNFVQQQINLADHLKDTSIALGVSVEDLQKLGYAFEQSGASQGDLEAGLNVFNRLIGQAAGGSKEAQKALKDIDWRGVVNGSIDSGEAFLQATDKIGKLGDETLKSNKAQELFGRGGKTLLAGLAEGRVGLKKLGDELENTGSMFTKEGVEKADRFNDSLNKLNRSGNGLGNVLTKIAMEYGPKVIEQVTLWVQQFKILVEDTNLLQAALMVLTGVVAIWGVTWAIANAPLILGALAIAALVLVVEDLITMFNGGQSVIGDFIDKFMGVGTSAFLVSNIFDILKANWDKMVDAMESSGLMTFFKGLLKLVGGIFLGTITATFLIITELFLGATKAITAISNAIEIVSGKIQTFGNWLNKLGIDKKLGLDLSSGPKPKDFGAQPKNFSQGSTGSTGIGPRISNLPSLSNPTMATSNNSESAFNNSQTNNLQVTVNAGAGADADEITAKVNQQVQKILDDNNRKTYEALRRTTKPVGAS